MIGIFFTNNCGGQSEGGEFVWLLNENRLRAKHY